ncbi:MAG TPA: hypothetical protein VFM82_10295 [Flavobacteriaceae bacterium]|nr:hypothetical protein [Flavobacteriaceae bacterium]
MKPNLNLLLGLIILFSFACKDKSENSGNSNKMKPTEKTEIQKSNNWPKFISESHVGKYSIGELLPTSSEIYEIEKEKQTRFTESGPEEEIVYVLSRNDSEELLLKSETPAGKTIDEIFVLSENYKTKEGIGVNSSLRDFINTYPDYKLWYTYVSDRYVLENSKSNIQFLLDKNDFIGKTETNDVKVPVKASDFKEDAKIIKIRLYK